MDPLLTAILTGSRDVLLLVGIVVLYFQQRAGGKAHDDLKQDVGEIRSDVQRVQATVAEVTGELRVLRPIVERRMQARPSTGD